MKAVSLFAGVGGIDIAAHWAGFETVAFCEWSKYPHGIMRKRFANAAEFYDIRDMTKESIYEKTGLHTVDIVFGGFPCQPFSVAGNRKGKYDDRYLWPEMLRVVQELRPTWVIGENVAGIISMVESEETPYMESRTTNKIEDTDYYNGVFSRQQNMLLHKIAKDLHNTGYEVTVFAIPACAVDANHERQRVFIVGYTKHNGLPSAKKPGSP